MPTQSMPSSSGPKHRHLPMIVVVQSHAGRHIRVRSPAGAIRSIRGLTELVDFLHDRPECDVGVKTAIIALGTALHCAQNRQRSVAAAFDEAVTALHGCKASRTLLRIEHCVERRAGVLTHREAAERVMAEARVIVRECSSRQVQKSQPLMRMSLATT